MDDLHYIDAASAEAGAYLIAQFVPTPPGVPRNLNAYRRGELPAEAQATIDGLVEAGLAVQIVLSWVLLGSGGNCFRGGPQPFAEAG